jgi:hypothetical protein
MTTVAEILTLSLKDVGVIGEGQTASATTIDDAFQSLIQMFGLWQADRLYVYAQKEVVATLTGAASYTIGAGGNIAASRPIKVDAAFWRSNGQDYDVEVFQSYEDYARLGNKLLNGAAPCALCYVPAYPLGTVYVYPNGTSGALHLITRTDLPTFTTISDTVSIPPEYLEAVRYSLSERLSTAFGTPLRPDIPAMAARARRIIKRNNVKIPLSRMPGALARNVYDIGRD